MTFVESFNPKYIDYYLSQGQEKMVSDKTTPTIAIARMSFGLESVKTILIAHLHSLAIAYGYQLTDASANEIASDIASGYPYLKITEIMLALKMMREGKFRDGDGNRGKMYGSLNTSVICDCINRFCAEYRNPILDKLKNEEEKKRREEDERNVATPEEKYNIVGGAYLEGNKMVSRFLTSKQMATLEYYAKERKALILLKQRVEEYLSKPESERNTESLIKGVEYINTNFPVDIQKVETIVKAL